MNCCGGTENAAARTSILLVRSIQGKVMNLPGPFTPIIFPNRNTTILSNSPN